MRREKMTGKPDVIKRLLELPLEMKEKRAQTPPPPSNTRLTVLQGGDVERLAAEVPGADARVSLHRDAVVGVLPQVRDVDGGGRRREVQVVGGVPQLQGVGGDDPVREQRRLPGDVHLAGTEGLVAQAVRGTARNCGEDARCVLVAV